MAMTKAQAAFLEATQAFMKHVPEEFEHQNLAQHSGLRPRNLFPVLEIMAEAMLTVEAVEELASGAPRH